MKEGGWLRSRREVEECWLRSAERGRGREGEMKEKAREGGRDGAGDGSKRSSLLTSFS